MTSLLSRPDINTVSLGDGHSLSGCPSRNERGAKSCSVCTARGVAICAGVDGDVLAQLEALTSHVNLKPGETLYHEGDPGDYLFTLIKGTVKQYKLMPDGRRQIIGFHVQGDFLGELRDEDYTSTLEAVTAVELCRFSARRLRTLMAQHAELEKNLLAKVGRELDAAKEHMLLLGRKTAVERIASFLVSLIRRESDDLEDGSHLHLAMSRSDIADHLGLTTETVSRSFTKLRDSGVVSTTLDGGVTVLDSEELLVLMDGDDRI